MSSAILVFCNPNILQLPTNHVSAKEKKISSFPTYKRDKAKKPKGKPIYCAANDF